MESVYVTISIKEGSLENVLESIQSQTQFTFIYDASVKRIEKKISMDAKHVSVRDVLDKLSDDEAKVLFKQTNNTISIRVEEKSKDASYQGEEPEPELKELEGVVRDENGEPLPSATVFIKGTSKGMKTDMNGEFHINVQESDVLIISYSGYQKQEIPVACKENIAVTLEVQEKELKDVVVIGYGSQSKGRVVGALSRVKEESIKSFASPNFTQQLSGKLSGIQINNSSGQPGSTGDIVIRGVGTLTAGSSPLIVVDGFPLSEGSSMNSINPQDIESIDVLKDASAAAIYGSRGANGVVLITTKKGSGESGAVKITLDAYVGLQQRADNVALVDAYDAAQYFKEARDYGYVSKNPANRSEADDDATRITKGASKRELSIGYTQDYLNKKPGLTNTNWYDEIFRLAPMENVTLAFSGKVGETNYYVSGNYFNQTGITIASNLERYTGAINISTKAGKIFKFGVSATPSYQKEDFYDATAANYNTNYTAIASISYPFFKPYNDDGTPTIGEQIKANTAPDGALSENPIAMAQKIKNNRSQFRLFGNAYVVAEFIEGLELKVLAGGDYWNEFVDYYNPSDVGEYRATAPKSASAKESQQFKGNYVFETTLRYARTFDEHEIDVIGGYSFQKEFGAKTSITGSGIPDDNIYNIAGASGFNVEPQRYVWTLVSGFGRAQYFYKNKYHISATLRADGSSRFGDNTKWGIFPSVGLGWIITEEDFMEDIKSTLSYLKVKGSWGVTGNNQIGMYGSQALVTGTDYVFGTSLAPGYRTSTSPNPDISWETNVTYNAGIDIGLWNKLTVSLGYYNRTTSNLLLDVPVPKQSGFSSSIQNIGSVNNQGFELELEAGRFQFGEVGLTINGNLTTYHNEVLALSPNQEQIITGAGSVFRTRVGGPIAELYGYQVVGLYKTQAELDSDPVKPLAGTVVGDYKVADINKDGKIDENDRTGLGKYSPDVTYGFGATLYYKGFELSFSFVGVAGRTLYDRELAYITEVGEGFGVPSQYYFDNRYHPVNNPNGFLAQPNLGNFSSARKNLRQSSIAVSNADYLRLRSLQLAYDFPKSVILPVGIKGLRLYLSANNLFTITGYRGFNPEGSTASSPLEAGFVGIDYPVARTFIFGCNFTF